MKIRGRESKGGKRDREHSEGKDDRWKMDGGGEMKTKGRRKRRKRRGMKRSKMRFLNTYFLTIS